MEQTQNKSNATPLQLVYWDMRGIAQPIRHLLEYLGVKYEQKIQECPNEFFTKHIKDIKKKCVSAELPLLKHCDFFITEPQAIIKYLCRKFGREDLLGKTPRDSCKVDELVARFIPHRNRICEKINRSVQYKDVSLRKDIVRKEFEQINKCAYWTPVYNEVVKNSWYLGYLTVADFFIYETAFYMEGLFPNDMEKYPHFCTFKKRFEEITEIKAYQESDRDKLNMFMVDVTGLWQGNAKYVSNQQKK